MTDSRTKILNKLRSAATNQSQVEHNIKHAAMVPPESLGNSLTDKFITEAKKLSCIVHLISSERHAKETILSIIAPDAEVLAWQDDRLPLKNLRKFLAENGVVVTASGNPHVRVGVTGVDAALAATGSLAFCSETGKDRLTSLLPEVHIALVCKNQIIPDLESWFAQKKKSGLESIRKSGNIVFISGPSRTADIAMELILGMHGPREVHILLFEF